MSYLAFDLEIGKPLQPDVDIGEQLPLGITCAATCDGRETSTYHGRPLAHFDYPRRMSVAECRRLARVLMPAAGFGGPRVVTYNGLGFDWRVLWAECEEWPPVGAEGGPPLVSREEFAWKVSTHVDIAFAMFCERGFMCSLDSMARGMGLGSKAKGMDGVRAAEMWSQGLEAQEQVLEYVAQDARLTGQLYEAILEQGQARWVTKRGTIATWEPFDGRLPTVQECLASPLPDTSWMTDPWPREKFSGWLEGL